MSTDFLNSDHTLSFAKPSYVYSKSLTRSIWENCISTKEHQLFFCRVLHETIDSILEGTYTNFDAQTTSNCCHGLAILVRELILSMQSYSLLEFKLKAGSLLKFLELGKGDNLKLELLRPFPDELIDLVGLYVLTLVIEMDPTRGRRTAPLKLQKKANFGMNSCKKIIKNLQKSFSNFIAVSYQSFFTESDKKEWIAGSTIQDWKKYVGHHYIRINKRGIKYVSCMFSMQVSLCYLAHIRATVALVNDLIDPITQISRGRYIRFLRNDGNDDFSLIEDKDLSRLKSEPIVVFSGYTFSSTLDISELSFKMEPWVHQFASLILACDTYYPQFPAIGDDLNFDSSPIYPHEMILKEIINVHSKTKGVSASDSSLFCLSHIFVSNMAAILSPREDNHSLPSCYIPCKVTMDYINIILNNRV